jgi:hypothetical protein
MRTFVELRTKWILAEFDRRRCLISSITAHGREIISGEQSRLFKETSQKKTVCCGLPALTNALAIG